MTKPCFKVKFLVCIEKSANCTACWRYYYFTFFLCHVGAMSSTCYNPLLYGWMNTGFRTEFSKLLPCLR
jgi:hypothetical protein